MVRKAEIKTVEGLRGGTTGNNLHYRCFDFDKTI